MGCAGDTIPDVTVGRLTRSTLTFPTPTLYRGLAAEQSGNDGPLIQPLVVPYPLSPRLRFWRRVVLLPPFGCEERRPPDQPDDAKSHRRGWRGAGQAVKPTEDLVWVGRSEYCLIVFRRFVFWPTLILSALVLVYQTLR